MSTKQGVTQDLEEVKRLIYQGLRGYRARVYFFGSRSRGQASPSSDIDVAILPLEPLPTGILSTIRERLEEGSIPYQVDLVDLSVADPGFKKRVIEEGILWIDSESE